MNARSRPTLSRAFESALLFGSIDNNMVLLQVYTDYDAARRSLTDVFGRGYAEQVEAIHETGTAWIIDSEKKQNKVRTDFFRPYSDSPERPPTVTRLVLLPCTLDKPIVANDFLDRSR